jgi:phosphoribosylformylglycinamidine synthase
VAVLQFPGVNCEDESVLALARAGLAAEVFRWTRAAGELARFDAFLLPGGWSYQDRVRAGALAAQLPLVDALAAEAARGRPVLGICNGAQVLVEAGLVPGGGGVELALARNRMPRRGGYYARWVEAGPCVFTRHLTPGSVLPLPVAHGEGRFTSARRGRMTRLLEAGQVPLRYVDGAGEPTQEFPDNPNGAEVAAAAVCSASGTVLAMMPHPERVLDLGAMMRGLAGPWAERQDEAMAQARGGDADAPGMELFHGLARHLQEA